MKKPILLILFAIVSTTVFCQTYPIDLEAVALTNFDKNVKKDQSIHFTSIRYENCAYFGTDVNIIDPELDALSNIVRDFNDFQNFVNARVFQAAKQRLCTV